jgi:hypothetical protein
MNNKTMGLRFMVRLLRNRVSFEEVATAYIESYYPK